MAMADEEEENGYVTIGSAFKQLETDDDVQREKNRKDKDQYVLDKQGRRRFHGAFTGGFSAGYYNTVGSKEGWSPSPFMSSRDSKASQLNQRPEDYMDDEDLDIFGIAPREIAARDQFLQGTAGGKRPHSTHLSAIPGEAPLQNLIVPARSSVGARLLKAMGWREGQGVGPKVMKYSAKKEEGKKIYGCALPNQVDEEYVDDAVRGFMFAPHDVAPWQFVAKDDHHGIGYQGMEHQPVLQGTGVSQSIYGMSGKAFGVGALEEDDEDIYSRENIVNFSVTEASEADLNAEQVFGWTGGMQGDWSLKCFSKTSKPDSHKKVYPSPLVPRDFVPLHKFLASSSPHDSGTSFSSLSSSKRAQLLSEPKTSADVHSVFDLMSPEDRDKLKRVANSAKTSSTIENSSTTIESGESHKGDRGSRWDQRPGSSVSAAITSGTYMPFANDPQKQERYQAFLQGHRKFFSREYDCLTEWEKQRELEQFSRSSNLYKPLAGALADKFTHAKADEEEKKETVDISDAEQAAEAGMFGVLTRDVQKWHPHRVLCKRFNIPDPYPDSALVGVPSSSSSSTNRSLDKRGRQILKFEPSAVEKPLSNTSAVFTHEAAKAEETETMDAAFATDDHNEKVEEARVKISDESKSEVEEIEKERPPMEVFRSIFAESSSESEPDDPEQQNPSSSDTAVMETELIQTTGTIDTVTKSRPKQQWQNFALVTLPSQPPPVATTAASFLTPTQEEKQAQSDNSTKLQNPVAETPSSQQPLSSVSLFGPPLPLPTADSESEDGGFEGERNTHSSRSKHTRHKSHHKHKNKKDKRKSKEHHKSRHRHDRH